MKFSHLFACVLVASLLVSGGCKTMEFAGPNWINQKERPRLSIDLPFQKKKEDAIGTPHKMAVIWKESTLKTAGNPMVRGFGGRVFFYNDENQPVKVDGEMVVYGFDTDSDVTIADKKFVFQRDKLADHYGKTDIGHSYSFWIPWDQMGGERTSITLIPAFKSADGKLVKGGQTINVLPGRSPQAPELKSSTYKGSEVQLTGGGEVGHVQQVGHSENGPLEIRETTIRLPKHLGNRIASLPGNAGEMNAVSIKRESIQVLDEEGRRVSQTRNAKPATGSEQARPERRERKPFGMPSSFN